MCKLTTPKFKRKKERRNLASNNKTPCGNYKQRVSNLADQYTESHAIITAIHPKLEDKHKNWKTKTKTFKLLITVIDTLLKEHEPNWLLDDFYYAWPEFWFLSSTLEWGVGKFGKESNHKLGDNNKFVLVESVGEPVSPKSV
jgi:hypothetical protein